MALAIERLYGRRGVARMGATRVHAIRNDDLVGRPDARCGVWLKATVGQDRAVSCPDCARLLAVDADAANAPYAERIAAAEAAIAAAGYTLRYVDACEGGGVGGLLGMGLGVTMWADREVRVRKMLHGAPLVDVLEHELEHVRESPGYERGTHGILS